MRVAVIIFLGIVLLSGCLENNSKATLMTAQAVDKCVYPATRYQVFVRNMNQEMPLMWSYVDSIDWKTGATGDSFEVLVDKPFYVIVGNANKVETYAYTAELHCQVRQSVFKNLDNQTAKEMMSKAEMMWHSTINQALIEIRPKPIIAIDRISFLDGYGSLTIRPRVISGTLDNIGSDEPNTLIMVCSEYYGTEVRGASDRTSLSGEVYEQYLGIMKNTPKMCEVYTIEDQTIRDYRIDFDPDRPRQGVKLGEYTEVIVAFFRANYNIGDKGPVLSYSYNGALLNMSIFNVSVRP